MLFVQMRFFLPIALMLLLINLNTATQAAKMVPNSKIVPIKSTNATSLPKHGGSLAWLKLEKEVEMLWEATLDKNNPAKMKIKHRSAVANNVLEKQILVLVPKKSKSYQLAINTLLKILEEHGLRVRLTLIHFNKDPEQAKAAVALAEDQNINLIFAIGSISVDFIHEHYRGGQIPVVTSTNKDPVVLGQLADYEHGSGTNIAFTSLNVPINIQIQYLFDLKPELRTVGLMYSRDNKQTVATEVIPVKRAMAKYGVIAIDIPVDSADTANQDLLKRIPEAIKAMQEDDPNLRESIFWITGSTAVFSHIKQINQLAGNIPVLGSISNIVAEGDDSALMAIGIDRRNNALLAGLYAVKILTGVVQPGELKLGVVTPPDLAINFRVARKIGLKIPLHFFESAAFIYNYEGKAARTFGQKVRFSELKSE